MHKNIGSQKLAIVSYFHPFAPRESIKKSIAKIPISSIIFYPQRI